MMIKLVAKSFICYNNVASVIASAQIGDVQ